MKYSIKEIAQILNISSSRLSNKKAVVSQLLTDSRSLGDPKETLFFALRTQNNDGHNYVLPLYAQGVRNFVVESEDGLGHLRDANLLVVPNTLEALQNIAMYHRRRFRIPVIGMTGSRGKTTVKEWLYELLKDDYHVMRSPRSYNSQIGVPLSLWDIDESTTLAIIEAGISTTGEMANLQAMIRPTIGVITNIGTEHNEGFSSMRQKAQEKAKILYNCDCIVYCADDPLVTQAIKPLLDVEVAQEMAWSQHTPTHELYVSNITRHEDKSQIDYEYKGEHYSIEVSFTGYRDLENVITCLAILLYLQIDPEVIKERMARLAPVGTRINVIEGINNCTVIADGYPSDYNSLTPAIDFMARRSVHQTRTVILSDLTQESFSAEELYIRASEWLRSKHIDRFIGVGEQMMAFSRYFTGMETRFFASTDEFLDTMSQGDFEDETILVKGSPAFHFEQILDMLEAKQHMTVEEVDLNALAHNFKFFKSLIKPTTKTVGMVKASGYGTGSYEIAKTLQDRGADYLAVAVQDEGVDLRKAGITMPIIVLNPSVVNYKSMFTFRLEPEVYGLEECRELIKEGAKYGARNHPVHIKIDSGMHRLGFMKEQLPELIELLQGQEIIRPASVFTHLCVADVPEEDEYTHEQKRYYEECAEILQNAFDYKILRHVLNTSGIVRFPEYQYDMVRIGIGLYGVKTVFDGSEDALQPVATLRSVVIAIRDLPAGATVGYGRRGVLTRDSRIATLTIGYADGLDRHFGNGNISVWLNGHLCPTVGTVCMDAVMIDVTDVPCALGDRVEIFGHHVPIEKLSEVRGTIPYEILTSISPRVKRVYYRE